MTSKARTAADGNTRAELSVLVPLQGPHTIRSARSCLEAAAPVLLAEGITLEVWALPFGDAWDEHRWQQAEQELCSFGSVSVRVLGLPAERDVRRAMQAVWPALGGRYVAWVPEYASSNTASLIRKAIAAMRRGEGAVQTGNGFWCTPRHTGLDRIMFDSARVPPEPQALPSPAPRPSAITADDWGLSPAVNDGILELARTGVVRRVSMLARGPALDRKLDELLELPIETGLHFDLVREGSPLPILLARWTAATGRARKALQADARARLSAQLELLDQKGIRAAYLDGHRHVHLLPGLLDSVADLLRAAGIRNVRIPCDGRIWPPRRMLINLLAHLGKRAARRQGFSSRPCLYPTSRDFEDYARLRDLIVRHPDHEIIVHPARGPLRGLPKDDPYTVGRISEYRALRLLACEWESEPSAPGAEKPEC